MIYEIYIKLTNGCQLKCEHCYNEIMMNHLHMTDDVLDKVIVWINEFQRNHPSDLINITFHGGEPMLYDIDKIDKVIDLLTGNFTFGITTNLIYDLTDKHIRLFKRMKPYVNESLVSTSWDYKIRFKGNQQEIWESNVKKLLDNNIKVQPIICLTNTLIKEKTPKDIFDYIGKFTDRFNFERITNTGRAIQNSLRPLNKDLDKWLFDAYKLYEVSNYKIPLFDGIESSLHNSFIGCRERRCMEKVITINPDGSISTCPNMANKCIGNIYKIDDNKKKELILFEKNVDINCLMCKYYQYCNGDCCQLEWDESGCPGMKSILRYKTNDLERE